MEISSPLRITSRLRPGCQIGRATISIEYTTGKQSYRQYYRWYIDLDGQEFTDNELASGAGGGSLQEGLESLLCFLGAFARAIEWLRSNPEVDIENVENADLFPIELADWAAENADEFAVMECELHEHPNELIVE